MGSDCVTHIIGEPKYKYGQQEQVRVRNPQQKHRLGTGLMNETNLS